MSADSKIRSSIIVKKFKNQEITLHCDSVLCGVSKEREFVADYLKVDKQQAQTEVIPEIEGIGNFVIAQNGENYERYFVVNKKPVKVNTIDPSNEKKQYIEDEFNAKYNGVINR